MGGIAHAQRAPGGFPEDGAGQVPIDLPPGTPPPSFILDLGASGSPSGLTLYALLPAASAQSAVELPLAETPSGPRVVTATNRVVVGFLPVVAEYVVHNRFRNVGVTGEIRRLRGPSGNGPPNVWIAEVAGAAEAFRVANDILATPGVRYAHPDLRFEHRFFSIDDALYPEQWHLNNTGQSSGAAGLDSNVEPAWDITLGDGVIVGLLDQGVDPGHPDYAQNVAGQFRNTFDPLRPAETGTHGTAMAGLISARDNTIGVRGVAPRSRLFLASVEGRTDAEITEAMYEADAAGADVLCNAWAPRSLGIVSGLLLDAVSDLTDRGRGGKGTVFVVSAGDAQIPVALQSVLSYLPGVITVGRYSNRGAIVQQAFGPWMDCLAPGAGTTASIVTTDLPGPAGFSASEYTQEFVGTSAATAQAAGVAALVLSANPNLSALQVERILKEKARRPSPNNSLVFIGSVRQFDNLREFSDSIGFGLIDAGRAVQAASDTLLTPGQSWPASPTRLRLVGNSGTGATISWDNAVTGPAGEYDHAMVVRFTGTREWAPSDGVVYAQGEKVDQGVFVVAVGEMREFTDTTIEMGQRAVYAVYTVNAAGRYSTAETVLKPAIGNVVVFRDDMEQDRLGWLDEGDWARGEPDIYTARGGQSTIPRPLPPAILGFNLPRSGANLRATRLDGFYSSGLASTLTSPSLDLRSADYFGATITYHELLEVEGYRLDQCKVEVIDDPPLGGDAVVLGTLTEEHDNTAYTWRTQSFDLTPYLGQKIRIRWTLESEPGDSPEFPGFMGWYLDDVLVTAACAGDNCMDVEPPPPPPPPPPIDGYLPRLIRIGLDLFGSALGGPGGSADAAVAPLDPETLSRFLNTVGAVKGEPAFDAVFDFDGNGYIGLHDLTSLLQGARPEAHDWRRAR